MVHTKYNILYENVDKTTKYRYYKCVIFLFLDSETDIWFRFMAWRKI